MQRIDIRVEDIIIVIMAIGYIANVAISLKIKKLCYNSKILILFVLVTCIGTFTSDIYTESTSILFRVVFWGKEVEYMSLVFTIPFYLDKYEKIIQIVKIIGVCITVNATWLAWQVAIGEKQQLLSLIDAFSYGYRSIGEHQPLSVASLYFYGLTTFLIMFFYHKNKISYILLSMAALSGILATLSRTFYLGTVCSLLLIHAKVFFDQKIQLRHKVKMIFSGFAVAVIILLTMQLLYKSDLPTHRLEMTQIVEAGSSVRYQKIWLPLLHSVAERPLLGYGKGSILMLLDDYDEAHNYALRLLVETGLLGFVTYALFIVSTLSMTATLSKKGYPVNIIANITIVSIISVIIMCSSQDTLYTAKVGIPFYFLIGLTNLFYGKYVCRSLGYRKKT